MGFNAEVRLVTLSFIFFAAGTAAITAPSQGSLTSEVAIKATAATAVCEKSHLSRLRQPVVLAKYGHGFEAFSAAVILGDPCELAALSGAALALALAVAFPFPCANLHLSPYVQVPAANFAHAFGFPSLSKNGPAGEGDLLTAAGAACEVPLSRLDFLFTTSPPPASALPVV